jgi:hypothetical protein
VGAEVLGHDPGTYNGSKQWAERRWHRQGEVGILMREGKGRARGSEFPAGRLGPWRSGSSWRGRSERADWRLGRLLSQRAARTRREAWAGARVFGLQHHGRLASLESDPGPRPRPPPASTP